MENFTHIDSKGYARMVDVTDKQLSDRTAVAQSVIAMDSKTFGMIYNQTIKKGNVLETARIAGIMAAKKTHDLIPMCHPLNITHISIDFFPDKAASAIRVQSSARLFGRTGVEMEALTAAAVAALTIYDMCKAYDKKMVIGDIFLLEKSGGKSGTFKRTV